MVTIHSALVTERPRTGIDQPRPIWDYQLPGLLRDHLYDKNGLPVYQDLELVFDTCYGGGMIDGITRSGGLKGNWSASSSVPKEQEEHCAENKKGSGVGSL
jgi:hypothetical protein